MTEARNRITSLSGTLAVTLLVLVSIRCASALMDLLLSDAGDRSRALGKIGSAGLAQFLALGLLSVHSRRTGAGAAEELLFRGVLIAMLARKGWSPILQVLISAAAFGLSHAGWSLLSGDVRIGLFATSGTTIAGLFFGAVYLASGRRLLPVVALHAGIKVVIEPWLVLAVLRGNIDLPTGG